jgi:hypothetical protein
VICRPAGTGQTVFFARRLRIILMLKYRKLTTLNDVTINGWQKNKQEPLNFGKFPEFSIEDLEYYQEREKRFSTPFGKSLSNYLTWLKTSGILNG